MSANNKNIISVTHSTGNGKYRIFAEAKFIGEDILISVWGGSKPHIGSIAISIPGLGFKNPGAISATTSIYNFTGHKDHIIATFFSEKIAEIFNARTVTTAGFHIDNPSKTELTMIIKNSKTLCSLLIKRMERIERLS